MNIQVLVCFCVYLWRVFENVCGVSLSMLVHVAVFFDVSLSVCVCVCVCVCVLDTLRDTTHTLRDTPNTNVNTETLTCTYTVYSETCIHIF